MGRGVDGMMDRYKETNGCSFGIGVSGWIYCMRAILSVQTNRLGLVRDTGDAADSIWTAVEPLQDLPDHVRANAGSIA